MPLTTRCPVCGRQFPVYAQQLKGRRSRVDCPQCGERLDAVAGLVDESGFPGDASAQRLHAAERLGVAGIARGAKPREPRPPRSPPMVAAGPPTVARLRPVSTPAPPVHHPLRAWRGWGHAAVVLCALLGLQLAWWWRADLLRNPLAVRTLSTLCGALCTVTPARLPGALIVQEPSLTPDATTGGLTLRLRVANRARLPQPAPLIELELYDRRGDFTAVRRFSPDEYAAGLPGPAGGGAGAGAVLPLAPGESRTVALALAPPREAAAGFKVRLR